jgi:tetratricopeptide (TPR) repeat protein
MIWWRVRRWILPEPAATPATLTESADRLYSIERFYSLVAGASEDRIALSLRADLQNDALHAAYTIEAWIEEVKGREEKYDRLANLARSVAPISDVLRILSSGVYTRCYAELVKSYEARGLQSILEQRAELSQSASQVDSTDQLPGEDGVLTALLAVVNQPEGRDDYVAWFQIGWLQWRCGDFGEAESSFRTAASFSQRHSPWYFSQSLRHEAFMQWRRGNFERSRATIRRALEVRRDPQILVEAARYAVACGQHLESQSFIDEALHVDSLIFVSVLADSAFSNAVTSTVDILVRQQSRSAETASHERGRWDNVIKTIRVAEKQGTIKLLPDDADVVFESAALPPDIDFPTAIYRAQQASTVRSHWAAVSLELICDDIATKTRALDVATEDLRLGKLAYNGRLDTADSEQRLAEVTVQEEHDAVSLPVVPPLKDEVMHGLMIGLAVLVAGAGVLACLSQWRFGSIPPLHPVPVADLIVISPILVVMVVFGLLGIVTFPMVRLSKAQSDYNEAANAAEERATHKLRLLANEGTKKRQAIKQEWSGREYELNKKIEEAQRALRAAMLAQGTIKLLFS